jgi:hypothetical protein
MDATGATPPAANPPGMKPDISAGPAAIPPAAEPQLPAPYHANTILTLPPPSDPLVTDALRATLVTVNLNRADMLTALLAIGEAAHIPTTVPRGRANTEEINIHLSEQPLLEALLQLESQSRLKTTWTRAPDAEPTLTGQYSMNHSLPGVWSLSGPFAFAITRIDHRYALDRDGKAVPGAGGGVMGQGIKDAVMMELEMRFEPHLTILQYPRMLEISEAVDDHDNSLLPPGRPPANLNQPTTVNFPLRVYLAYPPENAARRIALLRGKATYTLQLAATTVEFADPLNVAPADKSLNGIAAAFDKFTWNETSQQFEMTATYRKGEFKGDWRLATQGLMAVKPRVAASGNRYFFPQASGSVSADTLSVHYVIRQGLVLKNGGEVPPGMPELPAIALDLPMGAAQIDIPIEFRDLPLP